MNVIGSILNLTKVERFNIYLLASHFETVEVTNIAGKWGFSAVTII